MPGAPGVTGRPDRRAGSAGFHLAMAVTAGLVVAGATYGLGDADLAPAAAWVGAAATFLALTWWAIGGTTPEETARHARREDPARFPAHVALTLASIAGLGGIALVLARHSAWPEAVLCLATLAGSWLTIQTLYTLRYARLFYADPVGGIDFNQDPAPSYTDFAYLAFGIGMSYQVADTNLFDPKLRAVVLRHALLSYLLGAVVLAVAINLVSGLVG